MNQTFQTYVIYLRYLLKDDLSLCCLEMNTYNLDFPPLPLARNFKNQTKNPRKRDTGHVTIENF